MSGFLSNVAARNFGVETGIRPRLASLFEPAGGVNSALHAARPFASAVIGTAVETEPLGEGMHAQIRSRDANHPAAGVRDAGTVPFEEPMQELDEMERDAGRKRVSRHASSQIAHETNPVSGPHESSLLIPTAPAAGAAAKRSFVPAGEVRTQDGIAHAETSELARANPATHPWASAEEVLRVQRKAAFFAANANANLETSERSSLVTPASEYAGLLEQMRNAAAAMNAAVAAPARGRATGSVAETDSAPENSIHVTIGRIEVRAVAENKRVSPARSASPVMGLEEYLHRHAQRGGK